MNIVFMGTPSYARESLKALLDAGFSVVGVFTQPDRPKGRGGKTQMCETKALALEKGIPVFQVRSVKKEGVEILRALRPDLCVTAAFGQILSEEVLSVPPMGTVNVHASLLPRYRGSAPINWCVVNGEKKTGVTTMMTNRGIDTGDILLQRETDILPDETAGALTERLAKMGGELLVETVKLLEKGECPRNKQDEGAATYYPMLTKDMGKMDWAMDAEALVCRVRGLNPWPSAYTDTPHGVIKVLEALAEETETEGESGTVLEASPKTGLLVKAGRGAVRLVTIQAAGGKAMSARDYLRGHPMETGASFKER